MISSRRYRFERHNRLRSAMITTVLGKSRRVSGECFQIAGRLNSQHFPCLAVIVTRKVAKRAVDRNYARRIVRDVFRLKQHDIGTIDYIVRVKKPLARGSYLIAMKELEQLFAKLMTCLASVSS